MTGVTVRDAFENFDAQTLGEDASQLITTGNRQRFHERFGDVFSDGLLRGGEYFAIFEINSVDESVRESIATHVDAAFKGLGAAGHLETDISSDSQNTSAPM